MFHCFGCGKGGDVFSFVMEIEGLSFVETLRLLAKKAEGFTVYFLLNNTQVDVTPSGLTEVLSVKKRNDSYIRLYRLN